MKGHVTHGLGKPATYSHWVNMKTRCYNKNSVKYKTYGERGITVCDEWLDFKNFHEWGAVLGISHKTLSFRLKHGWSVEKAFTTPVRALKIS